VNSAYSQVPPTPLRTIPSFIDLQTGDVSTDVTPDGESPLSPTATGDPKLPSPSLALPPANGHGMRLPNTKQAKEQKVNGSYMAPRMRKRRKDPVERAKYDAEGM